MTPPYTPLLLIREIDQFATGMDTFLQRHACQGRLFSVVVNITFFPFSSQVIFVRKSYIPRPRLNGYSLKNISR